MVTRLNRLLANRAHQRNVQRRFNNVREIRSQSIGNRIDLRGVIPRELYIDNDTMATYEFRASPDLARYLPFSSIELNIHRPEFTVYSYQNPIFYPSATPLTFPLIIFPNINEKADADAILTRERVIQNIYNWDTRNVEAATFDINRITGYYEGLQFTDDGLIQISQEGGVSKIGIIDSLVFPYSGDNKEDFVEPSIIEAWGII